MAEGSEQRHPNLDEHHRNVIEQIESIIERNFEESTNNAILITPNYIQKQQQITNLNFFNQPLSKRQFTQITKIISACQQLTQLTFMNCQLKNLIGIKNLTELKHLKWLNLHGNKITTIPQWIVTSPKEESFAITFTLDEFITTGKAIRLDGNPITTPPIEIARRGNEAILNYYQQLESHTQNDYLFEAKMLIVGEPGAGKTSLARKINNPNAELPLDTDTTHGIDVLNYQFTIHQQDFPNYQGEQSIEGKTFTTNLWDFGGQKIYLATHRFFLSNRALYVLISDSRTENTDFNYWLHVVEMFSPQSPILIILNEKEQRQHQFDPSLLKSRFSNIIDVQAVDLSSDDHTRLNTVRNVIRHHISKLPHVGSPLPGSWLEVRDRLHTIDEPTIRPDQYLDICTQAGIDKKQDAMQLSQYFHDIGVFLHYQKDEVLKHTIFLDSNWTTNTIYALLDDKSVFNNQGIISKKQAKAIWRQDTVNDKCDEFFRLMKVFHLAFEFKNSGKYIVPAKLPFAEAHHLELLPSVTSIQLGYKYDQFMPRGLLFNLMVELDYLITDRNKIWKQAAMFFKGSHQSMSTAIVIEDHYTQTITLNITGENPRDLLIIIMDKLDDINRQYQKLIVTKQIPCICAECERAEQPHFYPYNILKRRELNGKPTIECEKSYIDVSVNQLLAQITNRTSTSTEKKPVNNRNQIFISYNRNDERIFERVKVHFKGVNNANDNFIYWEDTQIKTGTGWFEDIKQSLERTKVAVLLISADFLASQFIKQHELPEIFTAMKQQGATIIPVLVSDCSLKNYPSLSGIQFVNKLDKPLNCLSDAQKETYLKILTDTVDEALNQR